MVDRTIELTDTLVDSLMEDWFDRDEETFVSAKTDRRIGWEDTLEEGDSYSAYFLEAPTQEDLIKRAYTLANETLVVMDLPFKVRVRITPEKSAGSYTNGKVVCVNTFMFDDPELSVGEKLDTFIGTAIHEGCHLLYTDFAVSREIDNQAVFHIFNIIEDERIEQLLGEHKPGLSRFLEKSKYFYFDQYYLDYVVPKEKDSKLTPFDRFINLLLSVVRYPKYLKESEVIEFGHYLLAVKEVMFPFPTDTQKAVTLAKKIFEIIKEMYEDIAKDEKDKTKESEPYKEGSSIEGAPFEGDAAEATLMKDVSDASEALDRVAGGSSSDPSSSGVKTADAAEVVEEGIIGDLCEGEVSLGSSKDSFFNKAPESSPAYAESYNNIKRYIPSIARILKGHCREYKLTHRSMRSGVLDTNKLVEAYQGVPTVYLREGEVKTDKVSVCVLIDESGSMSGKRISAARDTAVLINEAVGHVPNVELFIYGHSGDERTSKSTDLFIYREKDYAPKFALGSVRARYQNRDGIAILEVARRVRSQTKNPVLFFILSDGAPCAGGYGGSAAMDHTRECVLKAEKLGFTIVQICINSSYDPATMFKHYIIMENMDTLAIELGKVIKRATMDAAKVRVL